MTHRADIKTAKFVGHVRWRSDENSTKRFYREHRRYRSSSDIYHGRVSEMVACNLAQIKKPYDAFWTSYHHFRDITFEIFDLENVGQGSEYNIHSGFDSQWIHPFTMDVNSHSMENIKICKRRAMRFYASSHHVRDVNVSNCYHRVGRRHGVQFSQCCPSMANIKIHKSRNMRFCFCRIYIIGDINVSNCLPSKSWSRSRSTIFSMMPFDGKYQKSTRVIFIFFIFAKVRQK